jgi:hypothetical protein
LFAPLSKKKYGGSVSFVRNYRSQLLIAMETWLGRLVRASELSRLVVKDDFQQRKSSKTVLQDF